MRRDGGDSAPRAHATRTGRAIGQGHGSDDGTQPVGADDDLTRRLAAVGESESDAVVALLERDTLPVELDGVLAERGDQRRVQLGPVNHDQGGAEPGRELVHGGRVEECSTLVARLCVGDRTSGVLDRLADAEPAQRMDRVGPERDAGSDLTQLGCLLEDGRIDTVATQGESGGETTNSCSHDQHLRAAG